MANAGDYIVVAAIDFGTTYSGYGFSFSSAEKDIKLNKNWGDMQGFQSFKAPTSVLLDEKKKFVAFGFEAEQMYLEKDQDEERVHLDKREKHLYRNFKMMLDGKERITTSQIMCSRDNPVVTKINVFTFALKYLKEHMIEEISKEFKAPVDKSKIRWVITVPAFWGERSKKFMRTAAYRAGCIPFQDSNQLIIALEPEAASFFCRNLELAKFDKTEKLSFPSGTRYLILDCGGGTHDMVVHEVSPDDNKVREICAINGGPYGGNRVNENFVNLLKELLGSNFIESFQKEEAKQWFTIISKFEHAKKFIQNDASSTIMVELPDTLISRFASLEHGKSLETTLNGASDRGISFQSGSICLSHESVKMLFMETIDNIVKGIQDAIGNIDGAPVDFIFMVGGFCENTFLQQAVKESFEPAGHKVLVPQDAQLAIIKGAVLFGHHPDYVVSRIARKTYGLGDAEPFRPGKHDPSKRVINFDGDELCGFIFFPLVSIGDEVMANSRVNYVRRDVELGGEACVTVYSLDRKPLKSIEYTDSMGAKEIGLLRIQKQGLGPVFFIELKLGGTEILADCTYDLFSGESVSTVVDFDYR